MPTSKNAQRPGKAAPSAANIRTDVPSMTSAPGASKPKVLPWPPAAPIDRTSARDPDKPQVAPVPSAGGDVLGGESPAHGDAESPGGEGIPAVVTNAQPADIRAGAWDALKRANNPPVLFEYGSTVTQIIEDDDHGAMVRAVTKDALRGHLEDSAKWQRSVFNPKTGETKSTPAPVPNTLPATMLAEAKHPLPGLQGITNVPCMASSGRVLGERGYHPKERIYVAVPPELDGLQVTHKPTARQVDESRDLILDELLGDFPYEGPGDKAAMVVGLIHPLARPLINGPTPGIFFDAPEKGSGKGLQASLPGVIALGRVTPVSSWPAREEERQKLITSLLTEGAQVALFDNLRGTIRSAVLEALFTATVWRDRILGMTGTTTSPNNALWLMSGNNAQLGGDLIRRVVRCRIDPRCEKPWLRSGFRHELPGWAITNRRSLVTALLTLVRNWIALGRPAYTGQVMGTYENWSNVMGGILAAAGIDGFLENLDDFYEEAATDDLQWSQLVEAWAESYGTMFKTATDLVHLARQYELLGEIVGDEGYSASGAATGIRSAVTRLGRALGTRVGAVIEGHRIKRVAGRKQTQYQLIPDVPDVVPDVGQTSGEDSNSVPDVPDVVPDVGRPCPAQLSIVNPRKSSAVPDVRTLCGERESCEANTPLKSEIEGKKRVYGEPSTACPTSGSGDDQGVS